MTAIRFTAMISALCVACCFGADEAKKQKPKKEKAVKEKIAVDQLPGDIKSAAEKAAAGIVLSEIRKRTRGEQITYTVTGTADGKEIELLIAGNGEVLKSKNKNAGKDEKKQKTKQPVVPFVPEAPGDF